MSGLIACFPTKILAAPTKKTSRQYTSSLWEFQIQTSVSTVATHVGRIRSCMLQRLWWAFLSHGPFQAWISLRVATHMLPVLVHTSSSEYLRVLPKARRWLRANGSSGGLGI